MTRPDLNRAAIENALILEVSFVRINILKLPVIRESKLVTAFCFFVNKEGMTSSSSDGFEKNDTPHHDEEACFGVGNSDELINVVDDLDEKESSDELNESKEESEANEFENGAAAPPTDHHLASSSSKCMLCCAPYKNALVSVNCWHVHCKTCWNKSLSEKKSCKTTLLHS